VFRRSIANWLLSIIWGNKEDCNMIRDSFKIKVVYTDYFQRQCLSRFYLGMFDSRQNEKMFRFLISKKVLSHFKFTCAACILKTNIYLMYHKNREKQCRILVVLNSFPRNVAKIANIYSFVSSDRLTFQWSNITYRTRISK